MKIRICAAIAALVAMLLVGERQAAGMEFSKDFEADSDVYCVITVRASTPGSRWSSPGPAPVLDALIDGRLFSNVVLFGGEKTFGYRLLAGPIDKGPHRVEIKPRPSRKSEWQYKIEDVVIEQVLPGSAEYDAYSYSPLLYGREENDISDVPLLLWVETGNNGAGTDFKYSFTWSNEDGGTKTASLMARYGRTVDTEHAITESVDAEGKVIGEQFQTFNHKIGQFGGKHKGRRPVLIVATKNNVFADVGKSSLLFSYAPEIRRPLPDVREVLLDDSPWIYRVMAEELEKENKLVQYGAEFDITKTEDPRTFIYMDMNLSPILPDFKVEAGVRLKGGEWHDSSRGVPELCQNLSGWSRVAAPVGRIPTLDEIESVRIRLFDPKSGARVAVRDVKRIMVLDADYIPHIMTLDINRPAVLSGAKPEWSFSPSSGLK